jgi:NitT/TauT family transport system ATP-binding protein
VSPDISAALAGSDAEDLVLVDHVSKVFSRGRDGPYTAVADVAFRVRRGEIACIVGKTGCGKSTLVNLLLGLDAPTGGRIVVDGLSPTNDFWKLKRRIAAVFQTDRMLPWRSVLDNAAIGLEASGVQRHERLAAAREWLARVGLEQWANAYPSQLSGGMRQRVALARAFVLDPSLLVLDEAFGHLDEVTAAGLRNDCIELIRRTNKTAIIVTHNIEEALEMGDRVVVLARPSRVVGSHWVRDARAAANWPESRARIKREIYASIESDSAEVV